MPRFPALAAPTAALALACVALAAVAHAPAVRAAGPVPASAKPVKLGLCTACHGEDGRSRVAGTPHLAGQDETYLRTALNAYRSGARRVGAMNAVAGSLQPRDIDALARWYSTRTAAVKK